jgi:alkanesulfonate monooxygenase SsuD/methylene tetrahydromethanopterin reductase-like flavin-dependent oxidoreductase (luciferase family)
VVIHGSPERVVDTLQRLEEEMPLDYLLLSPLSEKTFGIFTERVLPHVLS